MNSDNFYIQTCSVSLGTFPICPFCAKLLLNWYLEDLESIHTIELLTEVHREEPLASF